MKKTQKQMFEEIIQEVTLYATPNANEIVEFCNGRIAQLNKKSTRKPSKEDLLKQERKNKILEVLKEIGQPVKLSILRDVSDYIANIPQYSLVGLITDLKKKGLVIRTEEKGIVTYCYNFGCPTLDTEDNEEEEDE